MKRAALAAVVVAPLALFGCSASVASSSAAPSADDAVQNAQRLLQVTSPHESTGGTLLEGPTFGADEALYVDVIAPAGEPKVLRVDIDEQSVDPVYSDEASAFTSAQFSPVDHLLYLTDIVSGSVVRMDASGSNVETVFTGDVDGVRMQPDDLAFDASGAMFVTDTTGMRGPGWDTPGRVVRIGSDGAATVLAADLPSPNGIAFDETGAGLYVAQYNANRIDYYALDDDHALVIAAYPAIHVDGGRARVDSTAVDAEGNIYQAFHGKPEIAVYSSAGELIQTITVPGDGLDSATNVAIAPGATDGFITVSGSAGGFIYTFEALAEGASW